MEDQFAEGAKNKEGEDAADQIDRASAGPAICKRAPAPRNKPVPIAPPMAIICT
nr:Uncharacterised protein [Klebsiella pneumoniae]